MTDGQPASLSWNKAPIWGLRPDLYYLCDNYGFFLMGRPVSELNCLMYSTVGSYREHLALGFVVCVCVREMFL
jgi:hypothetical protein